MRGEDESSSEDSEDERKKAHHKEKHKKRKRSAVSSSDNASSSDGRQSSSSEDSSSSSSEDERAAKRRKKEKKEKKRRKKERKCRKKERKKSAKEKEKKAKKEKDFYSSGSVTNQYGKYGLLQESDMWTKRAEFSLWLLEVKERSLEELSGWEERELFKDYMEDYNTATLPSKKYYNLEIFEAKQRMKKTNLQETRELTDFDDEARRKREIKSMIDQRRVLEAQAQLRSMREDREKVDDMRQQKLLKSKIETLYRMGENAEAKKLAELLEPDK
ncbi:hypothetical protein BESB_002480 [Besnoitia besnoiti]|uniref:Uncharacterized protein n=1 Tax=Besnoitia besnoiti TaxID=94643 RepID=A0A2A9MPE7_BESBE|nr:hypothetical protein BESB_002480 [Besnoitia besnoiti]PFH37907.1 hypothetical protein BESB_002480 [Besnoitia besnoiti]